MSFDKLDVEDLLDIIDSTYEAIIAATPAGKIMLWNIGAEHVFKFSKLEAIGKNVKELVGLPTEVDSIVEINEQISNRSVNHTTKQMSVVDKNGVQFFVYVDVTRVEQLIFYITTISNAVFLRFALENSGYFVFEQDLSGRYIDVSV